MYINREETLEFIIAVYDTETEGRVLMRSDTRRIIMYQYLRIV